MVDQWEFTVHMIMQYKCVCVYVWQCGNICITLYCNISTYVLRILQYKCTYVCIVLQNKCIHNMYIRTYVRIFVVRHLYTYTYVRMVMVMGSYLTWVSLQPWRLLY